MNRFFLATLFLCNFIFIEINAMTIEFQKHHSRSILTVDGNNFTYKSGKRITKYHTSDKNLNYFMAQIKEILKKSSFDCSGDPKDLIVIRKLEAKPIKICSRKSNQLIAKQVMLLKLGSTKK